MDINERARLLKEIRDSTIDETIQELPFITEVFRNKEHYDLNKIVDNEVDFLLGAVLSQVINRWAIYCAKKGIKPSDSESLEFNVALFSKAAKYKEMIMKSVGL